MTIVHIGPNSRYLEIYREGANDFLIRGRINGENDTNRIVEWRLRKFTTTLSGWSFASNCWHLLGCKVIDISGHQPALEISGQTSAFEYAFRLGATNDLESAFEFVGSVHQSQQATAFTIHGDGEDLSGLATGAYAYARTLTVTQAMDTVYPGDKMTIVGSSALDHTFTVSSMAFAHSHAFDPGYQAFTFYSAMLPVLAANMDTYQIGDLTTGTAVGDNSSHEIGTQADTARMSDSGHAYQIAMTLPDGKPGQPNGWEASVYGLWINDRSDGIVKAYSNYVSSNFAQRVSAENSSHQTRYQVVRAQ